jgi:hypothetical protein
MNSGTHLQRQYMAKDKPWYRLGHGIVLLYIALGMPTLVILSFH